MTTTTAPETDNEIIITKKDTEAKLNQLAQKVYQKDVSELESRHKRDLVMMDIGMIATECTVSGAETRTTAQRYNTNNYMASFKLDLHGAVDYTRRVMEEVPADKLIDRYLELKATLYTMIAVKWEGHEQLLRSLLRTAEAKDGIDPIGNRSQ